MAGGSTTTRVRAAAALTVPLVIALGVASRRARTGYFLVDKSLGDGLYAVLVYLLVALLVPARSVASRALAALAACWVIEIFQATGIPARHAGSPLVRWLLGTTFSWHDMLCYVVGVALAALAERALGGRGRDRPLATKTPVAPRPGATPP